MTDIETYEHHVAQAEYWLSESGKRQLPEAGCECLMTAQVHASLAQAVAVTRMVETYDGWKSI